MHNFLLCMRFRADFLLQREVNISSSRPGKKIIHFCSYSRLSHASRQFHAAVALRFFAFQATFNANEICTAIIFMCRTVWSTIWRRECFLFFFFFFFSCNNLFNSNYSHTISMRYSFPLSVITNDEFCSSPTHSRIVAFRLLYFIEFEKYKCKKKNIKTSPISRIVRETFKHFNRRTHKINHINFGIVVLSSTRRIPNNKYVIIELKRETTPVRNE